MAVITLGQLRDLWKTVSDWVAGVSSSEPKITSRQLPSDLTTAGNLKVAILESLPAGTDNIGKIDVVTTPADAVPSSTPPSKGFLILGTDGASAQIVRLDTDGHIQTDILSSTLPSGAATEVKQDTIIEYIDSLESLLTTIRDTNGIKKITDPVDTELPSAIALGDEITNPTTPIVGDANLLYNGVTWDRYRSNYVEEVLTSIARTSDTNTADLVNYNAKGVAIFLDVVAVGSPAGQIDAINIQAKVGTNYKTIYSFGSLAINTIGQYAFLIYPSTLNAGSWTAPPISGVIPRNWRINVDHANDTDSITYSMSVCYLN